MPWRKPLSIILCLLLLFSLAAPAAAATTLIVNGYPDDAGRRDAGDDVKVIEHLDGGYSRYTDFASGFSFRHPSRLAPDWSLSAVRTVFADQTTRIEVYYDNLTGSEATAADYIHYSNKFVKTSPDHTILADEWLEDRGRAVHILQWTRRPLVRVPNDRNHYASIEVVKNDREVYTIFVKSGRPITDTREILAGFDLVERQGAPRNYKRYAPSRTRLNAETAAFHSKYFGDRAPLAWGIFEPSAPQSLHQLTALEKRLGYSFPILLHYQMFDDAFPAWGLANAYRAGKYVQLTLQTTFGGQANALWATDSRNAGIVYEILDGKHDDYFAAYADKLREFGHPVLFRLNNEMNGDWCWYSAFYYGKDAELYGALWRHLHGIFAARGADNVLWVWNPHDVSLPAFRWNHHLAYYPGDEYVDIVGLTGYNNGTYFPGEKWREFAEIYPPLHDEYANLFDKPFMITEFSSNSVGGDKVAWIHRMFDQIRALDRIKVAVWWSGVDFDQQGNPGRIYLINENEAILDAFQQRLKDYKK